MPIVVDLDVVLAQRKMSLTELYRRVGITPANLSVLKNGRARAVRFSTLDALCAALGCQPGDLLRHVPDGDGPGGLGGSGKASGAAQASPRTVSS